MNDVIWISWELHRRTEGICDYFSLELVVPGGSGRSITDYLGLIYRTIRHIRSRKPKVLIVQNPSIVLTGLSVFIRPFLGYRLIVDAHNEAVQPYIHDNWLVRAVSGFLLRSADLTIVTNEILASEVIEKRGKAIVLPDRLPCKTSVTPAELTGDTFNVVFIASFADDEPIMEVINAAGMLAGRITLYVTGNFEKLDESFRKGLPENIILTGFLSEDDYWAHLYSADAIIDLSLMDNCMVCGAYEGVVAARPLILSGNPACMQYFTKGVVYTDNSTDDIHRALLELMENYSAYKAGIDELGIELPEKWRLKAERLRQVIGDFSGVANAR